MVRVVHLNALEGRLVGKEQAVVEGVTGVDMVAHGDVSQFHGHHRGDRFLIGQAVQEPLADQNGVSDRGRLHGSGDQDARMQLVGKDQVVRHDQIHDNLIQNLVFIAAGIQRRHQTGFDQAVNHVVFGLSDPGAGGLQGADVL